MFFSRQIGKLIDYFVSMQAMKVAQAMQATVLVQGKNEGVDGSMVVSKERQDCRPDVWDVF